MTVRQLAQDVWREWDDNGNPAVGWRVYTYQPGTSQPKPTYKDPNKSASWGNYFELDARGEAEVWFDGQYTLRVYTGDKDDGGQLKRTTNNFGVGDTAVLTGQYNLVQNGAFEIDTDGDGQPDDWDIFTYSGGTATLDTSTQTTGAQSLKFQNTGSGGGYATQSAYSEVTGGETYYWSVRVTTNNSAMDVKVGVRWFDENKGLLSESTVYNETSSSPTVWTEQSGIVAAPSNARYAKARVYGGTGTTSASAWFDGVVLTEWTRFSLPPGNDLDNAVDGGPYYTDGSTANTPGSGYYTVNVTPGLNTNTGTQIAALMVPSASQVTEDVGNIYVRGLDAGTWSSWKSLEVREQRVELGNEFDAGGEVVCARHGNIVTITSDGVLSHTSTSSASSGSGKIPAQFLPSTAVYTVSAVTLGGSSDVELAKLQVRTDGALVVTYYTSNGSGVNRTDTINPFTITYAIADNVA